MLTEALCTKCVFPSGGEDALSESWDDSDGDGCVAGGVILPRHGCEASEEMLESNCHGVRVVDGSIHEVQWRWRSEDVGDRLLALDQILSNM